MCTLLLHHNLAHFAQTAGDVGCCGLCTGGAEDPLNSLLVCELSWNWAAICEIAQITCPQLLAEPPQKRSMGLRSGDLAGIFYNLTLHALMASRDDAVRRKLSLSHKTHQGPVRNVGFNFLMAF